MKVKLLNHFPTNSMLRVRLDNEDVIIGYVSGQRSFIRIRGRGKVSRSDSTQGTSNL
ncbi:hypothetical protein BHE74_00019018 [Ensete ventricosum]|uniref:Uncharacterized protein n=1 Tax=Ensete ventricosum TaxID=4639 RepID=A0A444G8Z0_ENSVE|nr:hypothetical protein B296_00000164 [Ensete ventricosum]RWW31334.1 hypothetical protein GW17_00004050 [Ensete ventricosum]RWW73130.1 hypothetical protein BHE74_00019018 [Ensete ventricosum]RZS03529.1 hypothetical protein BHM03_00033716 [Ensete ventricosum]